jgi:hypothetical protein
LELLGWRTPEEHVGDVTLVIGSASMQHKLSGDIWSFFKKNSKGLIPNVFIP